MSVVKHFIEDSIKKAEIEEFLQNEFERAGYGGVSITKTPLGTHLVIYTMRPGLVIGRGGETIRALARVLEEKFNLPSPQISVAEIEIPELNAYVVASRIASALKRGVHYRRAGFWGLTQAMEAGALGIEIIISGKLRTDRARYEKFREGYLPKSGEPPRKYMRKAELHVHLKPGTLGVKVRLIPPDAQFPDKVQVHIIEEDLEKTPERKIVAKEPEAPKEPVAQPETAPAPEPAVEATPEPVAEPKPAEKVEEPKAAPAKEEKVAEPEIIVVDDKVEPEKKDTKKAAPVAETKVEEKKPVETKVSVVKKKSATKKKVEKTETKKKVVDKPAEPEVAPEPKKEVTKPKAAEPKEVPAKKTKVAKKKVAKPKAAPVKEKKEAKKKVTKKVTKSKAPSAEEKKEAEA